MQKKELLHLHMLLFTLRRYFEGITGHEILTERYNSLAITPFHIHKDRDAHTDALFTLGNELVSHIHNRLPPAVNCSHEPAPLPAAALQ